MALSKAQLKQVLKHLELIRQAKDNLTAEAVSINDMILAELHLKRNVELDELIAAIKTELSQP